MTPSVCQPGRCEPPTGERAPFGRRLAGVLDGDGRRLLGLGLAMLMLVGAVWASVAVGINAVGLGDITGALAGNPTTTAGQVVYHLRIPRTATGVLAGTALGVAGTVMQGMTRNPLADPGLLGINAGAALAVVVSMSLLGITTATGFIWFALAGAAAAAVFVYALGSIGLGGQTPVKLALAGAATTSLLAAFTTMLTLRDVSVIDDFRFWAVGSLTRADGASLTYVAPFVVLGLLLAAGLSRTLNALALGEDLAQSLGTRLWVARTAAVIAVVLLAGSATAVAGPLVFVGLVVPHLARLITGPDYRWVMAWTVVLSPALLLLADVAGRVVAAPQQLQVGIVTALAGAPVFLLLVRHRTLVGV